MLPAAAARTGRAAKVEWPAGALEQIAAVKGALAQGPGTVAVIARRFKGARQELVERHLETLRILAEVRRTEDGGYHAAEAVAAAA